MLFDELKIRYLKLKSEPINKSKRKRVNNGKNTN